jgi:DNA-binding transcriptional LysR family regulator
MELRHLRYFVVVAEVENFHRAAERLSIVQSAVSRQIQDLEAELGVRLFERRHRRVTLSAMGKIYLEEARRILNDVDRANERVRRISSGQLGTLRVGFQATGRHALIPESFRLYRSTFPGVELKLTPLNSLNQVNAIREGSLDAGFMHRPTPSDDLASLEIAVEDFSLALPAKHPLTSRTTLYLKDLVEENFIWIPRTLAPGIYEGLLNACLAGGLVPRVVQEAVNEWMLLNLVSVGMGLAFIPSTAEQYWQQDISFRKVADFSVPTPLELVWHRENRLPSLQKFIELVKRLKKAGVTA